MKKTAVILAAFGSSRELPSDPLAATAVLIRQRHPGLAIFTGYTSAHVVRALRARGESAPTLAEALADVSARGFTQVLVQSMHVVPGEEYEMVRETVRAMTGLPKGVRQSLVGAPLIADAADAARLAALLTGNLPSERRPEEAAVYVGHGAAGLGGLAYPALQAELSICDPNAFVGVVEHGPDAGSMARRLRERNIRRAWLVPLLTVMGEHAQNDIFGNDEGSWQQTFQREGIAVQPVKTGLAFQPGVAEMWADHLDAAFALLKQE